MTPVRLDPKNQAEMSNAAAQMVIDRIAQQAAENERPLTEEEQQRLASSRGPNPDPFFEGRMVIFLHRIIEHERDKTGRLNAELKLEDMLRYAGEDRSYAIELVRQVLNQPEPAVRVQRWLADKAALVMWVVLGFAGLFAMFLALIVMEILH